MKQEIKEMIWLTAEDCRNIVNWWMHSEEMAKNGSRGPIRDSERETINKIGKVKHAIAHRNEVIG